MTCPQCQSPMIASPAPDVRTLAHAMAKNGAHPAYAQHFAETHHDKQGDLGVVSTCPNCRYVTRAKVDPAPRTGKAA